MLTHKDIPSRSGQVTVSHFIETEKNLKTEKTEEYVSNERTRTALSPTPGRTPKETEIIIYQIKNSEH